MRNLIKLSLVTLSLVFTVDTTLPREAEAGLFGFFKKAEEKIRHDVGAAAKGAANVAGKVGAGALKAGQTVGAGVFKGTKIVAGKAGQAAKAAAEAAWKDKEKIAALTKRVVKGGAKAAVEVGKFAWKNKVPIMDAAGAVLTGVIETGDVLLNKGGSKPSVLGGKRIIRMD